MPGEVIEKGFRWLSGLLARSTNNVNDINKKAAENTINMVALFSSNVPMKQQKSMCEVIGLKTGVVFETVLNSYLGKDPEKTISALNSTLASATNSHPLNFVGDFNSKLSEALQNEFPHISNVSISFNKGLSEGGNKASKETQQKAQDAVRGVVNGLNGADIAEENGNNPQYTTKHQIEMTFSSLDNYKGSFHITPDGVFKKGENPDKNGVTYSNVDKKVYKEAEAEFRLVNGMHKDAMLSPAQQAQAFLQYQQQSTTGMSASQIRKFNQGLEQNRIKARVSNALAAEQERLKAIKTMKVHMANTPTISHVNGMKGSKTDKLFSQAQQFTFAINGINADGTAAITTYFSFTVVINAVTIDTDKLLEGMGEVNNRDTFFQYLKFRAGKASFWKDVVLNYKSLKNMAVRNTSGKLEDRIIAQMLSGSNVIAPDILKDIFEFKKFTICMTLDDADMLKSKYDLSIYKSSDLHRIFTNMSILTLAILDIQDEDSMKVSLFDSDNPTLARSFALKDKDDIKKLQKLFSNALR